MSQLYQASAQACTPSTKKAALLALAAILAMHDCATTRKLERVAGYAAALRERAAMDAATTNACLDTLTRAKVAIDASDRSWEVVSSAEPRAFRAAAPARWTRPASR